MKILLTGASSFTGSWFALQLAAAGHEVTATFRVAPEAYAEPGRRKRLGLVAAACRCEHGVSFGDDAFVDLVRTGGWDVLAHHAAHVTNYRSPDFDALAAAQSNTRNLRTVVDALEKAGCRRVVLTGSFFEPGEGAGSQGLPGFSPYALSKSLTSVVFHHYCGQAGLRLGKFVIPNPFGPHEESRYTAYLLKTWLAREGATCATPAYIRDNIPASLLAKAYVRFVEQLPSTAGFSRLNPSGYVESQGAFTARVAAEMRARLQLPCAFELKRQTEFPEPRIRVNTDALDAAALGWDEAAAWEEFARYYLDLYGR
jgi:nucleoside-diphosphate-sugar epimerase